jgi:phasin
MLQCTIPDAISSTLNKGSQTGATPFGLSTRPSIRIGPRWAAGPAFRSRRPDPKDEIMSETAATAKAKAAPIIPLFELPKFDLPKFDMPKLEVPAAFREIAEKGVAQAKDAYEKVKAATEEATDLIEDTYTTAVKGTVDYNLKVIEAARANANAAFDFASELIGVKSLSEVVELTTAHARKQFETVTEQTKELTAAAQKLAAETAEPIKSGVTKAFKKVA